MARSKKATRKWTDRLDPDEVAQALEEATVDAHDEYEQHSGLLSVIEDELEFPFRAKVLGQVVEVVGMEWPEDDEYGLDLICEVDGEEGRIEARSVELLEPFPAGHLYLAAYLDWKRRL